MVTRREKARLATIQEIKTISWALIRERRSLDGVTINEITRRMEMSAPAFYSYFKSREALIRVLVIELYENFRRALTTARDSVPASDVAGQLYNVFIAYREWSLSNPVLFSMLVAKRAAGLDPQAPEIAVEIEGINGIFLGIFADALQRDLIRKPATSAEWPVSYREAIRALDREVPMEIADGFLRATCLVQGMIAMELSGRIHSFTGEPAAFYTFQIRQIVRDLGLSI